MINYKLFIITLFALSNCIRINVVPHTHDDAGWIWTFEQYYSRTGGAQVSVKSILDNMVLSLEDNPERTFIYVEIAYFTKWYKDQKEETKLKIKSLLKEGRFEFINGGYVMHDEATTYYQDIIDQMRIGLLFLKEEFNYVPTIAWFIDPFGHSAANAYLMSKMNFEKIVFVRIDQKEKDFRKKTKSLEFFYRPFGEIDSKTKIFTHVTYDHYCTPKGMENLMNDKELEMSQDEIVRRSATIYNDLKTINSGYNHDEVLMMYGCDFTHNERNANFRNLEKIMEYMNKNYSDMNLFYSTPSKYFNSICEKVDNWPDYNNQDFFPYAEYPYSYWTGYFTSRPYLKGLVRETSQYLLLSSRFMMEFLINNSLMKFITKDSIETQFSLRERLAICQHHDAVAGTAKELVSEDYISMLDDSIERVKDSLIKLIPNNIFKICIFNPTVHLECQNDLLPENEINQFVYILNQGNEGSYPVNFNHYDSKLEILDDNDKIIPTKIVCRETNCKVNFTLNFNKNKIFNKISIRKTKNYNHFKNSILDNISINLSHSYFKFDKNNLKFTYKNNKDNKEYNFSIGHGYYNAYTGENSEIRPAGVNPAGAYIFSPKEETPIKYEIDYDKSFIVHNEDFIQITIKFENSYLNVKILEENIWEIETEWGLINQNEDGKDYLLIISSDIENNIILPNGETQPEFWTDSNGIKMMRRIKDFRQGYDYKVTEKIASNFYPVNYMISMRDRLNYDYDTSDYKNFKDDDRILSLINDRSQSIGSMTKGEFIIILNRHSKLDDWKGLEEPLFEKASAQSLTVKHLLVFGNKFNQKLSRYYFNNQPAYFILNQENVIFNNYESFITKLIEYSSNIIINFHIINKNKVYLQLSNLHEPYLSNGSIIVDKFSFKNIEELEYSIEEYTLAGTVQIFKNKHNFLKAINLFTQEKFYYLQSQEIRLFLLNFK